MAVFRFSALSDGQAISFDPTVDVLNFDQATIAAADLRVSDEGGSTRITVVAGAFAGKDVVLSTIPERISITNVTFADGSALLIGDARSGGADNGANNLVGTSGRDNIAGLGGNDTLSGGGGNDIFVMAIGGGENYGADSIDGGAGFDLLDFSGVARSAVSANISATGTVRGGGFTGGGSATVVSIEGVIGGDFNDVLIGGGAANRLEGGQGNDTLDGSSGNDTLRGGVGADSMRGGSGNDQFIFADPSTPENADRITDFLSGTDKVVLDRSVFSALGAGSFAAGDGRFFAAPGATSGQDADDRVIYNTTTGQLFYDADGNGARPAELIATLNGVPAFAATDISVVGTAPAAGEATPGNDSLVGTAGDDSMQGLGGNDTLDGLGGNDTLDGGTGADLLRAGAGNDTLIHVDINDPGTADTLDGGLGDDLYDLRSPELFVDHRVVIADAGGLDTAFVNHDFTMADGLENVEIFFGEDESTTVIGNASNNLMTSRNGHDVMDGAEGNDTMLGLDGGDRFVFRAAASGDFGQDSIDGGGHAGGEGVDALVFDGARGGVVVDLRAGTATGPGISVVFTNIEDAVGSAFNDRITGHDGADDEGFIRGASLIGLGGDDTLTGGVSNDRIDGGDGNDSVAGGGGGDDITGGAGNDAMTGGDGNDRFGMSSGTAASYGADVIDGGGGFDTIDFSFVAQSGVNANISASVGTVSGGGAGGAGSATVANIEGAIGGGFNDVLIGGGAANLLEGGGGNDTLDGSSGNDTLHGGVGNDSIRGGSGNDQFVFAAAPGAADADRITDFLSGTDKLAFTGFEYFGLGTGGNFAAGDPRFAAGAGFTSGQDSSDRLIYNTATGQLFYDADGSGAGAAQLVATLNGAPALAATDITVI